MFPKWLTGPSIEDLKSNHDIPGLWKRYSKHPKEVEDALCDFADEAWDFAFNAFQENRAKHEVKAGLFAMGLTKRGYSYAGTRAETPIEFASRFRHDLDDSEKRLEGALCPVCGKYLTESPVPAERGMYRVCSSCDRRYHRECAARLSKCQLCEGDHWRWDLRK